jgi:hypothetical protein
MEDALTPKTEARLNFFLGGGIAGMTQNNILGKYVTYVKVIFLWNNLVYQSRNLIISIN